MKKLYIAAMVAAVFIMVPISMSAQTGLANPGCPAGFGVDADIFANSIMGIPADSANCNSVSGTDDWFSFGAGSGIGILDETNPVLPTGPVLVNVGFCVGQNPLADPLYDLDAFYARDNYAFSSNKDTSAFQQRNQKSFTNPELNWDAGVGSPPDKTDIIDAFSHLKRDKSSFDLWFFGGVSLLSNDGTHHADYELYKDSVRVNDDNDGWISNGDDFGRTEWIFDFNQPSPLVQAGDIIFSFDFVKGGDQLVQVTQNIALWMSQSQYDDFAAQGQIQLCPTCVTLEITSDFFVESSGDNTENHGYARIQINESDRDDVVYTALNTFNTDAPVWGTWVKDGPVSFEEQYNIGQFSEIGVNMTRLGLDLFNSNQCFQSDNAGYETLLIKSRTSASFTAELKDYIKPTGFGQRVIDISCETTQNIDCANDVGEICASGIDPQLINSGVIEVKWYREGAFAGSGMCINPTEGGIYTARGVVAATGCVFDSTMCELLIDTIPPEFTITGTDVRCFGEDNGSIDLEVTSGTAASYAWTGTGGYTASTEDISDLPPGEYCVIITGENGCVSDEQCVTISEPEELTASLELSIYACGTNVSCYGADDGYICVTPSGGNDGDPRYTLTLSPGGAQLTSNGEEVCFNGLTAGDYSVYIVDELGCDTTYTTTLTEPDPLVESAVLSIYECGFNISCFGYNDGSIDLTVSGGASCVDYTYVWSGPGGFSSSSEDIDNLYAGEYCITITDANGCTISNCYTLSEPDELIISDYELSIYECGFNISCFGYNDGSIDITIDGGAECLDYTYSWTGPAGFTASTEDIGNLIAGTYCVEVTDANGCMTSDCYTLTEPDELIIEAYELSVYECGFNISCFGYNDGWIDITIDGGAECQDYTYSWTGPAGFTASTEDISDLIAGTYCVEVTDANGCFTSDCYTLTEPDELIILDVDISVYECGYNVSCRDANDGWIDITIDGGAECIDYNYSWTGPGGFTATTEDISNLFAGTYCVEVTDANGCMTSDCYTLTEPDELVIADAAISTFECGYNVSCNGGADGSINLTIAGGASCVDYSYAWTGPAGFTADTEDISNLVAGEYCVRVEDANGCYVEECYTLTEPEPLVCEIEEPEDEIFCGSTGNTISADTVYGGCPDYSYSWSVDSEYDSWVITGGANTPTVTYTAGTQGDSATFTLEITDANGCVSTCDVRVGCRTLEHCTLTQGYYGNPGGLHCDNSSTNEVIENALSSGDIILGDTAEDRSITFTSGDGACIIQRLPGGSTPKRLNGNATCDNPIGIQTDSDGRFRNNLLSQTLTLAINLRLDTTLSTFTVGGGYMITIASDGCGTSNPGMPVPGTEDTIAVPDIAVGLTVGEIFDLANQALAGQLNMTQSTQIVAALDLINKGFDECRFVLGYIDALPERQMATFEEGSDLQIDAFPNPAHNVVRFEMASKEDGRATVELLDQNGMLLRVPFNGQLSAGESQLISFDVSSLEPGIYFYRMMSGNSMTTKKLVILE